VIGGIVGWNAIHAVSIPMVVVEEASERVGSEVSVTVTNVLQTTSGGVFARLGGA
jgi:hypothetical protein